ncbi:MAG: AraC family transcriptional regulator [Maricaulis sp.]|nr:AraC family transcriptional regulator [Maricaulis sp.]
MTQPQSLFCLIFPGFQILDLTGPLAMFAAANRLSGQSLYALRTVAPEAGPVLSSAGLIVQADLSAADAIHRIGVDATLLVAGGEEAGMRAALRDDSLKGLVSAAFDRADRLASVCSGSFFLAASGRLTGCRITTHWQSAGRLQRLHPDVEVDADAIHVRDGRVWTSAGVTAGIDLALAMIEADHGRQLALDVARQNVVQRVRAGGQGQYAADLVDPTCDDDRLTRLAQAIRAKPDRDWSVETMCEVMAVSPRTLSRLCRSEAGLSPAVLVERVRLDAARHLLVSTRRRIDAIARQSGFGTHQRMDRSFMRRLGVSPRDFRARFASPLTEETVS